MKQLIRKTNQICDTASRYLSHEQCVKFGIKFAWIREFLVDAANGDTLFYYHLLERITDVVPNPKHEEFDQARFSTAKLYEIYDQDLLVECISFENKNDLPNDDWTFIHSADRAEAIEHKVGNDILYYAFNEKGL